MSEKYIVIKKAHWGQDHLEKLAHFLTNQGLRTINPIVVESDDPKFQAIGNFFYDDIPLPEPRSCDGDILQQLLEIGKSNVDDFRILKEGIGKIMSQQDDLAAAITALATDVDGEVTKLADVEAQLTELQNANSTIDLSAQISAINAMRTKLGETVATATTAAAPTAPTT